MLTFSVLWVVCAAAVTVAAMIRRSVTGNANHTEVPVRESGAALAFVAVVSCLVLLAGFAYVGRFLVSGL